MALRAQNADLDAGVRDSESRISLRQANEAKLVPAPADLGASWGEGGVRCLGTALGEEDEVDPGKGHRRYLPTGWP